MKKVPLIVLIITTMLSGCTQLGGTYFKRSYISIADSNKETVGTILVWEADTSAAILFKDGEACMQTALAIKTANMKAEAKLSDAILNLSKTAQAVAADPAATASSQALLDVSGSIQEAASMLTTTTERTAFLNMGMFYICQIAANDSITPAQAGTLITTLITSASGMKKL
ncbi:hypothetical protein [Teredinibacter waterburyi]|uniref:hypothetical protein n=1 Tax=Teredinibacter waterburyi TaxID=1500538 RepID=UPI00165F5A8F|nr:hypothetical protein [Teredinibacter waterburyi]